MFIRNIERAPAPVRSALVELNSDDLDVICGALRRLGDRPGTYVSTFRRRERARLLLLSLTGEKI